MKMHLNPGPIVALPLLLALLVLPGLLAACGPSPAAEHTPPPTSAPADATAQTGANPPASTATAADAPIGPLVGTAWSLVELGTPAAPTPALPDHRPTIAFAAQTATGSTGCNEYRADYTIDVTTDAPTLAFGSSGQTLMACVCVDCPDADAVMDQEMQYMELLLAAESFAVSDDRLTLTAPAGVLVFERGQS